MNDKLKRLLYLVEYNNKTNKTVLKENVEQLYESKKTEADALRILQKNNPSASEAELNALIEQFKQMDRSKNQILLPFIATMYKEEPDIRRLSRTVESINRLMKENKIRTILINQQGKYEIDGKTYDNYLRLTEFIHSLEGMGVGLDKYKEQMVNIDTDETPIFENDSIAVYDGNEVGKCIKYGKGTLTGREDSYSFCIGLPDPSSNMWQSYRDKQVSTFYYVVDKTRTLDDPLHLVVVDHQQYENFELTDANNKTGNIAEFGSEVEPYFDYLKSKGVPVDKIFEHKPVTPEEARINKLLGTQNDSLEWFKNLDPDPVENFKLQMNYVGRGYRLSDEQFKYLWDLYERVPGAYQLLMKYVDTGLPLPETQFNILVGKEAA